MSSSKVEGSGIGESMHGSLLSGRSKSTQPRCGASQFSRPYVLFSATNAASAVINFSKGNVNDGVVDSLPSQGPFRLPMVSASSL